jgi:hypothetical protein
MKLAFPPFLEEDNDTTWDLTSNTGGGSDYGRAVTKLLNTNLKKILELDDQKFIQTFTINTSFVKFLDTFLRFRQRTIDALWVGTTASDVARSTMVDARKVKSLNNLDRRVVTTFYRLLINNDTNSSIGQILTKYHVIDVPKLLDMCALYGRKHPTHVRTIVENAMKVNPSYLTEFTQAWAFTSKSLRRSAEVVKSEALRVNGGGGGGIVKQNSGKQARSKMRDVLKFVLDMLDTTLGVVDTCPDIFLTSCSEPAEMVRAIASYLDETLIELEAVLNSCGGVKDVETNAIHVVRSLSLRLSYSIMHHCLFEPLEASYKRSTSHATKSSDPNSNNIDNNGETKTFGADNSGGSGGNSSDESNQLWVVLNDFTATSSSNNSMKTMRLLLQTHYNIAGRIQKLIDTRVLIHDIYQPIAAKIFEDAPIPVEIMEDELSQESDIDIILRESKNKEDAISKKIRGNSKVKKDKKGNIENDWMQQEDGSKGGRRNIDEKLRAYKLCFLFFINYIFRWY